MLEISLFLVPTPIGNLGDMTFRAVEVLKEVDLILAEDTRTSGRLMKHFEIGTQLKAYHAHNEHHQTPLMIQAMQNGQKLALITDAGTPGISDPGFLLARACRDAGLHVSTLPGATAFVPALVNSGLPADAFTFIGFLPQKKGRKTRLQYVASLPHTVVLYESPHRIGRCLRELAEHCGEERLASVSREISKKFETTRHGTLQELADFYTETTEKGEFVVVVGPQ